MQAKTIMNTLHQNATDLGLPIQNYNILTTGIVCSNCSCHTGRSTANNDNIVMNHISHQSL